MKRLEMNPSVWITTDCGGSDPDDFQSMVHLLHYSDLLDIRGITAGAPRGKRSAVLEVIKAYERDKLHERPSFPPVDILKEFTKQGGEQAAKQLAFESTRHNPTNPLLILVWGACTDLAQAIRAGLKCENCFAYIIGSWNRDMDPDSYREVERCKPLRKILNNSTFRGMYMNAPKVLNNKKIITEIGKYGALGKLLIEKSAHIDSGRYSLKAGDTPSVLWALTAQHDKPTVKSWGGRFTKVNATTWTDLQHPKFAVGAYKGAKTVSRWQAAVRKDWIEKVREIYPR